MSSSTELKIPTQTFLLPGQEFCVGLPWERAGLAKHGLPPAPPAPAPSVNPFDKAVLQADPVAGLEVGQCQVIRRLSSNSADAMLAMRADEREGTALVVLRKIELPEDGMGELLEHAHWASHFRHPNLARVYGTESSDEGLFWVTEFASGASLHEINATCRKVGKGVPMGLALSVAYETALALSELHVPGAHAHGMVSDATVFVSFDGLPKLLDLGLMRCISGKILRPEGLQAMAPYLSPEQVQHGRMPDPKTDVYALAAVLHECLSGQKLPNGFERQPTFVPPSSFNVSLGISLDTVILRALDADRSKRYTSAAEFAKALKAAASAFMWKPQQRAEFVSQLFQMRKHREQILAAGCQERVWKPRTPTAPKLLAVGAHHTTSMRAPVLKPLAAPVAVPAKKSKKPQVQQPPSALRAVVLTVMACGLAYVWQQNLVEPLLNPPEPVLLGVNAGTPLKRAPLQVKASTTEPAEEVSERSLNAARAVVAEAPKPRVAARKKAEAPLPPWLQPRGKRR
ncbi:MAG: protein kinase [Myxococcaceae bacterium]|nr:protein kinase [Myxococcaceae bacterium]